MGHVATAVVFTEHAMLQMHERDVAETDVRRTVESPDQRLKSRSRIVFHKLIQHRGAEYLLRVFCEEADDAYVVVTVYPTSKVSKYWGQP